MRDESLAFLKEIVDAPSPSGFEAPAAEAYRRYTGGFADSVRTDVHRSVHAALNPTYRRDRSWHASPGQVFYKRIYNPQM